MPVTPFLPEWRRRLAPMGQRVGQLRQQSLPHLDLLFGSLWPAGLLSQSDEGPNSREHIYSVRRTFFGFLYQVLNPGCPCREIVRQIQSLFALLGQRRVSGDTGAYCLARGRLPLDLLARLRQAAAARAGQASALWHGWRVKVIDGTGLSMPDTPENQRASPQSREQKPGCGFPLMKVVAVFCLATGSLLDYAKGNKHQHDLGLLRRLLDSFRSGGLALADRGFCCYTLLDAQLYPPEQLALLYARRWQIELWFRDIKTSMGMEVLRCQSPQMIDKELEMFFIAYNLIRCLMVQASRDHAVEIQRLSFKGAVDGVRQFSLAQAQARSRRKQKELSQTLLQVLARDLVPHRPDRREPRAVKRRPKPCAWLTRPRHQFKDASHRSRHWKNKPRKIRT